MATNGLYWAAHIPPSILEVMVMLMVLVSLDILEVRGIKHHRACSGPQADPSILLPHIRHVGSSRAWLAAVGHRSGALLKGLTWRTCPVQSNEFASRCSDQRRSGCRLDEFRS